MPQFIPAWQCIRLLNQQAQKENTCTHGQVPCLCARKLDLILLVSFRVTSTSCSSQGWSMAAIGVLAIDLIKCSVALLTNTQYRVSD